MTTTIGIRNGPKLAIHSMQSPLCWLALHAVRMDPALDQRNPLLMIQDHLYDSSDPADQNGGNGYQPNPQVEDMFHSVSPEVVLANDQGRTINDQRSTTDFLVELTGIEPVASWLQTRRSPS